MGVWETKKVQNKCRKSACMKSKHKIATFKKSKTKAKKRAKQQQTKKQQKSKQKGNPRITRRKQLGRWNTGKNRTGLFNK